MGRHTKQIIFCFKIVEKNIWIEVIKLVCYFDLLSSELLGLFLLQIWKMQKLWVGFLKLVSQTQPHSFDVLLQVLPCHVTEAFLDIYNSVLLISHHAATCSYLHHSLNMCWISIPIFEDLFLPLLISGTCITPCPGTSTILH